jgi:monovalent cation:H+ antiporter-2, CPA2 family
MAGVGIALGKLVVPFLVRKVAYLNSRELLILMAVTIAIAMAYLASLLGISPALGAFLAGVVIADSQENHEVFAETRPLRDLFVALFFVSLGFLITPGTIINNLPLVVIITLAVLAIKFIVVLVISELIGNHIKTAIYSSFGLAQVGEFAIIIYSGARGMGLISQDIVSLGVSVALLSLIITPFLFKWATPFWKKVREYSAGRPWLAHLIFKGGLAKMAAEKMNGHIVICGFGRVGAWVGKALSSLAVPYIVIDYNQKVVDQLKSRGIPVIFGDPIQPEILEAAQIGRAKAVVVAIPDRVAQEELIMLLNRKYPNIHIIGRAHFDEDVERLKLLEVDKVVQPEFEGAVAIVRSILTTMGKSREEVGQKITSLRLSRAKT